MESHIGFVKVLIALLQSAKLLNAVADTLSR